MLRHELVLEYGALKFKVMGDQSPISRITRGGEEWLRRGLSWKPSLHLDVIDRVAET
jgi:hypothetical protein